MLTISPFSQTVRGRGSPSVFRVPEALSSHAFQSIRRRMMLNHCKWDSQIGDVCTLANFPLVLGESVWRELSHSAEQLASETLAAEEELLQRPELHRRLAIPSKIRRVLRRGEDLDPTPAAMRIMRFDFHPTTDGWQISEVNSDVPGGFTESSSFTSIIAEHYSGTGITGNPADAWTEAMLEWVGDGAVVALLSAAGFMEDQQIVTYLRKQLETGGCRTVLATPEQLRWRDGFATMNSARYQGPLAAIVRFYQAEWMARLPRRCGWFCFFCGGRTPVVNPGTAILTESKRLPLVWDDLTTPMSTWRSLLPETRDPRDVAWKRDDCWLLKPAFCNTGDTVSHRSLLAEKAWSAICREVDWFPGQWAAQRRFDILPINTPLGFVFPCIGVYTINGRAAGAYGRIGRRPLIDFEAIDVAILVERDDC